jgi:hypothetical protein
VVDLLLGNTLTEEQRQIFLLAIANNIKSSKSVPMITRLLCSTDLLSRSCCGSFMAHRKF